MSRVLNRSEPKLGCISFTLALTVVRTCWRFSSIGDFFNRLSELEKTYKNPSLDFCILGFVNGMSLYHYSATGSENCDFHFPSFSIAYSE